MSDNTRGVALVGAGAGAEYWNDFSNGLHGPITALAIGSGDVVDSIQVTYGNYQAPLRGTDFTGLGNPPKHIAISNDDPIVEITGSVVAESYGTFLSNLSFKTLKGKSYGPYGRLSGKSFDLKTPPGTHVAGLFGTTAWTGYGLPRWYPSGIGATLNNQTSSLSGGGAGMAPWSDNLPGTPADCTITNVRIGAGDVVDSLQFTYGSYQAPLRGTDLSTRGNPPKQFAVAADDPIVAIHGVIYTSADGVFLSQLTFKTLKGTTHGPYGLLNGQPFEITAPTGANVVGFFGTTGWTGVGIPRWYPSGLGAAFGQPAA